VNASWLFHQYFDGLVTRGIIPCVLVRPERVYEATTCSVVGRESIRYRIEVLMDFTSEDGLQELLPYLHDGAELVGPKQLRTYIHAIDPQEMCRFFELKHGETKAAWKKKAKMSAPLQVSRERVTRLPDTSLCTKSSSRIEMNALPI
jgi:hypothetical protein